MRCYLFCQMIHVSSTKNPLRLLMTKLSSLNRRLTRGGPCHFLQDEATEVYIAPTAHENQVWHLFFKGALRVNPLRGITVRVAAILIFPQNHVMASMSIHAPTTWPRRCIANRRQGCI